MKAFWLVLGAVLFAFAGCNGAGGEADDLEVIDNTGELTEEELQAEKALEFEAN